MSEAKYVAGKGAQIALIFLGCMGIVTALYFARAVFEPLAFALFIIALSAPMMRSLQPRIGQSLALILTVLATIGILSVFFSTIVWGVGRVIQWGMANLGRFDNLHKVLSAEFAAHGWPLEALLPSSFDPRWIIGPATTLLDQFRLVSGFALLVFVFVVLGLTELDALSRRLPAIEAKWPWLRMQAVASDASTKFRLYMRVRLIVSVIDSLICYVFFRLVGLDEPLAWAILVGTLNFIPFIGPLIVSIFLAVFAGAQFGSLGMMLLVLGGTSGINFILGSYVEPRVAGSALSMSAVLVLFSVFFWTIFWGIPGAFIGVQMTILILAICRVVPSANWIAELLSGDADTAD